MRKGKFLVVGLAFLLGIGAAYGAGMTDVKSRVLPAVYKSKTGLTQKVEISVKHEGNPTSVTIRLGEQSQKARLQPGDNTFYVEVPAVESTQALPLTLTAGKEQQQATVQVAPVRHWQVNFVQHTHTDIGYTRSQMEILQEQLRYIDYALDYCDLTDDYRGGSVPLDLRDSLGGQRVFEMSSSDTDRAPEEAGERGTHRVGDYVSQFR